MARFGVARKRLEGAAAPIAFASGAHIVAAMSHAPAKKLRRGWTTGACATAAVSAALERLWGGAFPETVTIALPRGERPAFDLAHGAAGEDWAEAGIVKDAGDDPDVTHGALIVARVAASAGGVVFAAGEGVGTVTMPGLPVEVGEPAINPVPRRMMREAVEAAARAHGRVPDIEITLSIPGGEEIARRTWNPRLGILGGLSILGTTGVVRPFSCSAWIASIHRGVDVARAAGLAHVAGCTGATSEAAVQALYGLPDHAMLDMGDFAGGLLKYLRRNPVPRLTIGGGLAKLAKLGQGAADLHSARSRLDMEALARWVGLPELAQVRTALHAFEIAGPPLAEAVAQRAREAAAALLKGAPVAVDVVVVGRDGTILARAG